VQQLVGQNCARCGEGVRSELDARFCRQCGSPVHDHCMTPANGEGCPTCGAPPRPDVAAVSKPADGDTARQQQAGSLAALFARAVSWGGFQKSQQFDVPGEGEPAYDPGHVATHRIIVRVGKVCGAVGIVVAGLFVFACLLVAGASAASPDRASGVSVRTVIWGTLFVILIAAATPVAFYFYGTSVALLFAPSDFLRGPIGRKWLKVAGVKGIAVARVLCFVLLIAPPALIALLVLLAVSGAI